MVTIRQFRDLPEAILAQGILDSSGIECYLANSNIVRMDWFVSNAVGGVKLQVNAEDVDAANEVLNQPIPENFMVDEIGEYDQPHCPKCESMDTAFQELNKPVGYTTAWLGLPIALHEKSWKCISCGYTWDHSEIPEED